MDARQLATQARLDGVKSGLQRVRVAFLVTNVAAAAMFISGWNAYFSRTHHFLTSAQISQDAFVAEIQRENIAQALQGEVITVALLGIRVRVVDFALLGSLGMLLFACWMYQGLRGHYASVVELLGDTRNDEDLEFRRWIAHAINSFLVFSVLSPGTESGARRHLACRRALWYIPAVITGLAVGLDLYMAHIPAAPLVRASHVLSLAKQLDPIGFYASEIASFVVGIVTLLLCRKVARYDRNSDVSLWQYYSQIPAAPGGGPAAG